MLSFMLILTVMKLYIMYASDTNSTAKQAFPTVTGSHSDNMIDEIMGNYFLLLLGY